MLKPIYFWLCAHSQSTQEVKSKKHSERGYPFHKVHQERKQNNLGYVHAHILFGYVPFHKTERHETTQGPSRLFIEDLALMHRGLPRHLVSRPPIVSRLPVSRGSLSPLELSPDCLGREGLCPEAPCVSIAVCLEAPCVSRLPVSRGSLCVDRCLCRGSLCLEGLGGVVSRGSLCLDRCVSRGSLSPLELSPDCLGLEGLCPEAPCVSIAVCLEAPCVSRGPVSRCLERAPGEVGMVSREPHGTSQASRGP